MTGSKFHDRSLLVVALLFAFAAILIGCGGSGGGGGSAGATASATGSGGTTATTGGGITPTTLAFNILWPASTRALPPYANCIVLNIQHGTDDPIQKTINRASKLAFTQKVSFVNIPSGQYSVHGTAYLDNDAQGPVVALFTATVTANNNAEVDIPTSFASTIQSVAIDGVPVFMLTGVTAELTGHAMDKDGNILILPPGSLTWSITQGGDLVELTSIGFLSALAPGDVSVQLQDAGSGVTDTADITITGDALTTGSTDATTGLTDATTTGTTTDSGTTDATTTGTDTTTTDTTGTTGTTSDTGTGGATGTSGTGGDTGIG